MKAIMLPLLATFILPSCRESLIVTQDEIKQQLLIGNWMLTSVTPPSNAVIFLNFNSTLVVDITVVSDSSSHSQYNFRVENGDLYFRSLGPEGAEFYYKIDFLSETALVISFTNGIGERVTQTYGRTG